MDDTLTFLTAIADQGIDYIHVSVGRFFGGSIREEDSRSRVELIQQHIGSRVPVIGVGGLQTLDHVKEALQVTPLVSLGHALIMDPDWLAKVQESRDEEIYQAIHLTRKQQLDIPENLWNMVTNAPGWFRVEE
ncbi:hypothetical protein [Planococcus faecalis]|nr:hypothetical protein [Planococcus faecalis]